LYGVSLQRGLSISIALNSRVPAGIRVVQIGRRSEVSLPLRSEGYARRQTAYEGPASNRARRS
jgi:hypothetical protein